VPVPEGKGEYYAPVGHDVLINSVVRTRHPRQRGAVLEAKTGAFLASNAKVQFIVFDFVAATFDKPAALPGWVGESREYAFRRGGITALDDERAVDYGSLFHGFLLPSSKRN
jgi:hypothetical protein